VGSTSQAVEQLTTVNKYVRGGIGTLMEGGLPAIQLRSRRVF
jgi:hypothetical protein